MSKIIEHNYRDNPELIELPLWVNFSSLPLEYLSWEAVRGIASMVGTVDNVTQTSGQATRHLGYRAQILFDTRKPLPAGVTVLLANGNEAFIDFIYENLPSNLCLYCYTIKHTTESCANLN